jgi:hypothetical protein
MFCEGIYRDPRDLGTDVLMLTDRVPYTYRQLTDTIVHNVNGGETLWQLSGYYYRDAFQRPSGLWWVIADFQPESIFDPTIALIAGNSIFIPSVRTVKEKILDEARRRVYEEYV